MLHVTIPAPHAHKQQLMTVSVVMQPSLESWIQENVLAKKATLMMEMKPAKHVIILVMSALELLRHVLLVTAPIIEYHLQLATIAPA